jgi:putative salt-induced outer membrane protein
MRISAAAILVMIAFTGTAHAVPLPPPVEAMIREAAKSGDLGPVAKVAKATNPDSGAEVDALVSSLNDAATAAHEEKLRSAGPLDSWSGSSLLGFSHTTGNTQETALNAGLDLAKDGINFRHKIHATAERQATGGLLTRNAYLANYELDYKFNERIYAYGSAGWDKDTFAGIERRYSESGGLGYIVVKTDAMTLDVNAGPAFRQTRYDTHLTENDTTLRASLDYIWHIREGLTLTEKAEAFLDSEITSITALTVPVHGALSAQVAFNVSRQEKALVGRDRIDTATRVGLLYSF